MPFIGIYRPSLLNNINSLAGSRVLYNPVCWMRVWPTVPRTKFRVTRSVKHGAWGFVIYLPASKFHYSTWVSKTQMRAESHYRILLLADCAPYFCPNWRCLHKRTPIDLASRRLLLRCQVLARETQVN